MSINKLAEYFSMKYSQEENNEEAIFKRFPEGTIIPDPKENTINGLKEKRNHLKAKLINDITFLLPYYGIDDESEQSVRIQNAINILGINK